MPTRKRALIANGVIPHITQLATSRSWNECDTSSDPHIHKTMWAIYFVHKGHATFTVVGETFEAGPGDCITVPPGTTHVYKVAPGEEMELFYLGVATD